MNKAEKSLVAIAVIGMVGFGFANAAGLGPLVDPIRKVAIEMRDC